MRIKLKQMVIRGGMLQILVAVSLVSPCFLRAHVSFSADTSLLCSTRKLVLDAMHTYIHKSCMHTMICFSAAQLCTSKVCYTHHTPTAIIYPSFFFSCLPFVSLLLWCGCTGVSCCCKPVANRLCMRHTDNHHLPHPEFARLANQLGRVQVQSLR